MQFRWRWLRILMDSRHFYDNRFFVFRSLFQRTDQLPQIFNRIDIMMRRGEDGVRASGIILVRDTSPTILVPGRCPPIPGFAPCPILISNAGARLNIFHERQSVLTLPVQWCFLHSNKNLHGDHLLLYYIKSQALLQREPVILCAL